MFKNTFKNILIAVFVAFLTISGSFATNSYQKIEQKREYAQKNIHKLKLLERIETNKLYRNQQKLEQTEQNLNINKQRHDATQEELVSLKKTLGELMSDYQEQTAAANRRIVQIYKTKRKNYVEFLLNAHDINNLLDRLYFENLVMRNDKIKIKNTQIKTRKIMSVKSKIEIQERNLAKSIKIMDKQQKNIQSAIDKNERYIQKLKTDRATWERAENELAKQSAQLTKLINKSTESDKDIVAASGSFLRPVGGRVSSQYGWRTHPIFKKSKFHSGVDLAAPMGTQIRAANSGKVIYAGWYGGYGKVIIIDHGKINGNSITTLYAHMSSYQVAVGTKVVRGQTIGRVGTTGYSTGPHLHFEVRVNGKTSNPRNYIVY